MGARRGEPGGSGGARGWSPGDGRAPGSAAAPARARACPATIPRAVAYATCGRSARHRVQQLGGGDGLGQERVHARRQAGVAVALHHVRRHRDDGQVRCACASERRARRAGTALGDVALALPDVLRGLDARHVGHLHVHQTMSNALVLERPDGLAAGAGDPDAVAGLGQQRRREALVHGIVFDHQHAAAVGSRARHGDSGGFDVGDAAGRRSAARRRTSSPGPGRCRP